MDLRALIPVGSEASCTATVTPELTVQHVYPSLPPVYATPQMICLMEMAAADAIAPYLPAGWGSVGVRVDVRHFAATPVGMDVTASARVVAVHERAVRFACTATDTVEVIGNGYHERAPVELERFVRGVERKSSSRGSPASSSRAG